MAAAKPSSTRRRPDCSVCRRKDDRPSEELRARVPFEDLQASDKKKKRLEEHDEAYHHEFRWRMPTD